MVVSSDLHRRIKRFSVDDPALRQRTATITGLDEYGTSKVRRPGLASPQTWHNRLYSPACELPHLRDAHTQLANILFANELARRLRPADGSAPTITVNSLHPGGVCVCPLGLCLLGAH